MDTGPAEHYANQSDALGRVVAAHSDIHQRIADATAAARESDKLNARIRTAEFVAHSNTDIPHG